MWHVNFTKSKFVSTKFYWNTATPGHSHIVNGCLCMTQQQSFNRIWPTEPKILSLAFYFTERNLPAPASEAFWQLLYKQKLKAGCVAVKHSIYIILVTAVLKAGTPFTHKNTKQEPRETHVSCCYVLPCNFSTQRARRRGKTTITHRARFKSI